MNYILVLIATILLAFEFAFSKKYQESEGTSLISGLRFNTLSGFFTAIIFFALSGFKLQFSLFSLIMAFLMSLLCMLYSIIGFQILRKGNMSLYSLFLMSGGMLLPYIFGILFLQEPLTLLRILGILFILAAVYLSNPAKCKLDKSQLILCVIIFIMNGFVSIISKCHQINITFAPVDNTSFVMYSGICKCIMSSFALLFCKSTETKYSFATKKSLYIILGAACISGISYTLQLMGAKALPASVLYPLITGGSIIFSTLCGKLLFKEKVSKFQIISVALCFIGTCLFL
jgi:drug/metabolite transporter (DMT)-like permease